MNQEQPRASSLMGPVRGPTYTNSLAKWALSGPPWRNVERDYRTLVELGVISDHCQWIFDVAEADCARAITVLQYEWMI